MGHLDRIKGQNPLYKMNIATWLSLIIAIVTLSTPRVSAEPRVVCYYTNWSVYRPGTARFNPQNINPYLCTHLIYAFGGFTKDNTLKPFDKYQDIEKGGYAKFTGLKTYNKNLKTMLAIGGWNEGSTRFSPMVASRERRKEFVRNVIKFLRQNRFDGLDLDWEYPAFRDGGKPKDRENYSKLVRELREEFDREAEKTGKPRLLLTMAVPAGIEYIQKGFDVKTLNQYLDWMNLLTYDYHSAFEPAVNHHAPLYPLEEPNEYSVDSELNIDYTIKFYLESGADRDKLVLGIPTYGRSYTLFNADAVEIGSPADGPGEQGDATREKGYLAYYEICEALKPKDKKRSTNEDSEEDSEEIEEEWTVMHPNPNAMGPVAYKGNQWVGYDDVDIVRKKAEYVAENGLGGIMFWSIDNDDFRGNCHGKPYPLIEAAKEAYIGKLGSTDLVVTERTKVRPSAAKRRNRPKSSTTTTTVKPSTTKSNKRKSSVSSTTPAWNITPEPPTTPDPGADFKCVDEGFYPHPRDCKKYFWCLDSGPSNLGIVAHQFTCPSGLFFNKAADSCDFARNVLCKMPASTTKAPATRAPSTTTTRSTTVTTRKPVRLSTKNSVLFRTTTTTTTTPEPESEEEYEEDIAVPVDTFEEDAEDPRVIKELIDLIKKVGGVEQLEKQLHLAETAVTNGNVPSTTPSAFNKKLYQKVLERTRGKNKYTGKSISQESAGQNSQRGPQNQGLEPSQDKDRLLKKDRPQYTTINRQRPTTSPPEPDSEEVEDPAPVQPSRARAVDPEDGTTARPLQYVNIRRARPTTSDTADDTASRNALFERAESYVTVSQPNSLDIVNARRENQPEYVTIRRQRPTTEETTTIRFEDTKESQEVELQETALEREISSQPQYTSIVRTRATTPSPDPTASEPEPQTRPTTASSPEKPSSLEPTTILAVQISSLLNSPNSDVPDTTAAQTTETETTTTSTTTTTAPSSTGTPRRPLIRRRGSTTTTTVSPTVSSSTTQVSARNYSFIRRRRPNFKPNEISDSDNDIDLSRKIRSTTPDSREVEGAKTDRETRVSGARRFRSRFQTTRVDDSVSAAASPVPRGQFRPRLNPDEVISLTPIDVEPQFVPRQTFASRNENRGFRGRTTAVSDSEASAATIEASRPSVVARGRSRYTFSTTTEEAEAPIPETTPSPRRPTFARFSPRPFARPSTAAEEIEEVPEDNVQVATLRTPPRLPFGRSRPTFTTSSPIQARKLPFTSRFITTQQSLVDNEDEESENKHDDIHLSESAIEEKEHEENDELEEVPKRRVVIKKLRAPTTETSPTETIPIDEDGRRKFRIIRRRPVSTAGTTETVITTETPVPRIRKIIRKKLNKPVEDEPEIIAKSIGSLDTSRSTEATEAANYGEKRRLTTPSATATVTTSAAEFVTENIVETSSESEIVTVKESDQQTKEEPEENDVDKPQDSDSQDQDKPEVVLETEQKAIDLSENKETSVTDSTTVKVDESSPETTTASTSTPTSSSLRTRLPYRPQKRIFTSTTEATPSSSRTFSRKFNPGVYTSPASVSTRSPPSFRPAGARRPASQLFTRRPFTTARTTKRPEEEEEEELYSDEELLEEEPENPFAFVPSGQFYSKRPEFDKENDDEESAELLDEEEETDEEDEPQNRFRVTTRKPFKPRVVNSNTFRTSTSTTELPKKVNTSQNKTAIYSRFGGVRQENDTKKRVQNVPVGYSIPVDAKANVTLNNELQKSESTTTETATDETTTDDDEYLSMTDETTVTGFDTTNTDNISTNTIDAETSTLQMEISTNDYLEYTEQTTYFPTTQDATTNAQTTLLQNTVTNEQTTTQTSPKPTTNAPVSSKVKTQFDKLFSVSRVVEVSSKLDKHRLNKKNETTLIEEGEVMQEKKPMVDKIGEVSRYSLIKIVQDEIPIYLTKLGHVYPVENPPDNIIRIDEARNARALTSYFEPLRENLVASESVNEAYRHVQKAAELAKGETAKDIEKVPEDDFLSYVNDKNSDKIEDPLFAQWQFVPAAYENEQNKATKTYEIVTPRSMQSQTNPSTLPLQSLFLTEAPTARKISDNNQPFVVYSASVPTQKEDANIVKLEVLKPETGRSIITFAKGQEFSGAPLTEETTKSPINVSILPQTVSPSTAPTTTTESILAMTSPIVEMLSTPESTITETTYFTTTEVPSTTETMPDETTTVKLNPVEAKRAKYGLLRRPIIKTANTTRFNIPRPVVKKSNVTVNGNLIKKTNKTSTFSPNKSRFSANRAQNVPVDLRKKPSTRVPKVFTTESPRTTTERKPYFKPGRPTFRPAFVPRRTTLIPTTVIEDSS